MRFRGGSTFALCMELLRAAGLAAVRALGCGAALRLNHSERHVCMSAACHSVASDATLKDTLVMGM